MPENVPYNLDMSKYETADESSSTDSSSAATDAASLFEHGHLCERVYRFELEHGIHGVRF